MNNKNLTREMDDKFFSELISQATKEIPNSARIIQSFQYVHYKTFFNQDISSLDLCFINIIAGGLGSCFIEPGWIKSDKNLTSLVGQDILNLNDQPKFIRVAGLDAAYGVIKGIGADITTLHGHPARKVVARAEIVAREANRALSMSTSTKLYDFACVGVVGSIVNALQRISDKPILLTENNQELVGQNIASFEVRFGEEYTLDAVAKSRVAIVTAMTIANGTFQEICETARRHNTELVVFAQTGANFGKELLQYGVTAVIAEPFPFYNMAIGPTNVYCYRR